MYTITNAWGVRKIGETSKTKRTALEIMAEMVSFCQVPQVRTRMMHNSNLSWQEFQKYLFILESNGFLSVHHSPIRYVATQKGLRFVEMWKQLAGLMSTQ